MTAPIPITPLKPGPTGGARSGALAPFTDLTAGIDTNFAATKTWATQVANCLTPGATTSGWLTPAAGWAFLGGPFNIARRIGRFVQLQIAIGYTGTITSTSTGLVSPALSVGTITAAPLRPAVDQIVIAQGYAGVGVGAQLTIAASTGAITLSGMSATLTATNPGFCFIANYFAPVTSVVP